MGTGSLQLAAELARRDLRGPRREYLFRMPGFVARPLSTMLADTRDEPIVHLLCNQLLLVVPAAVLLFLYCHSHIVGALYFALNYALFLQRFMLTLHVTEHRKLFKAGAAREGCCPAHRLLRWVVPPRVCGDTVTEPRPPSHHPQYDPSCHAERLQQSTGFSTPWFRTCCATCTAFRGASTGYTTS